MLNFLHQCVSPFKEVGHHFLKPFNVLKGSIKFLNGYKNLSFWPFYSIFRVQRILHMQAAININKLLYTILGVGEEARISNVFTLINFLPT